MFRAQPPGHEIMVPQWIFQENAFLEPQILPDSGTEEV